MYFTPHISMKHNVRKLIRDLYITKLWKKQQSVNPVNSEDLYTTVNVSKLKRQSIKVLNHKDVRALIALGVIKPVQKFTKDDYFVKVDLTKLGEELSKQKLFSLRLFHLYVNKPSGMWSEGAAGYWNYSSDIYKLLPSRGITLNQFEKWLVKYPNIDKIAPLVKNKTKTEACIKQLFLYVYAMPMDDDDDQPVLFP